jgi:hypothetical protein
MLFWPVNEMIELVSGMPAPNSGTNLRECEDQNWLKAQAVPVFRFDSSQVEDHCSTEYCQAGGWHLSPISCLSELRWSCLTLYALN